MESTYRKAMSRELQGEVGSKGMVWSKEMMIRSLKNAQRERIISSHSPRTDME